MQYLWYWNVRQDAWELLTAVATGTDLEKVRRSHKRRLQKGARLKWTSAEQAPKRFRTRSKRSSSEE